eukprot:TRINITY_DN113593_c0_g1_i1.p1 TRINITY_DN113593_c0_g1~~TRINITY_DN113593_c0_g1_i1.p1  ORF type:complete len:402 (+),score=191.69 TRINITY_DN113593_c0_g1_i1:27-1208(+)
MIVFASLSRRRVTTVSAVHLRGSLPVAGKSLSGFIVRGKSHSGVIVRGKAHSGVKARSLRKKKKRKVGPLNEKDEGRIIVDEDGDGLARKFPQVFGSVERFADFSTRMDEERQDLFTSHASTSNRALPSWMDLTDAEAQRWVQQRDRALAEQREAAAWEQRFDFTFRHRMLISLDRRVRVTRQGKMQSYSALVLGGNGYGFAGFGIGRGLTPQIAQDNAWKNVEKNLIRVPIHQNRTIAHPVEGWHNNTKVIFYPRESDLPLTPMGGIQYAVAYCLGIVDASSKVWGGRNRYSQMYATFNALSQLQSLERVAQKRGRRVFQFVPDLPRMRTATREQQEAAQTNIKNILLEVHRESRTVRDQSGATVPKTVITSNPDLSKYFRDTLDKYDDDDF